MDKTKKTRKKHFLRLLCMSPFKLHLSKYQIILSSSLVLAAVKSYQARHFLQNEKKTISVSDSIHVFGNWIQP